MIKKRKHTRVSNRDLYYLGKYLIALYKGGPENDEELVGIKQ